MKAVLWRNGAIMLEPETEFEEDYLRNNFKRQGPIHSYLKHGANEASLVGMVLDRNEDNNKN